MRRRQARAVGPARRDAGLVLPLGLVYLAVLGTVVVFAIEAALLQFRMAGNYQLREQLWQQARALVHEITVRRENFALDLSPGQVDCAIAAAAPDCDFRRLPLPEGARNEEPGTVSYRVSRRYPDALEGAPLRERDSQVSSARFAQFALYEVAVSLDHTARGGAAVSTVRGLAIRVPEQP